MVKKIFAILMVIASISLFAACGNTNTAKTNSSNDKKQEIQENKNDKTEETKETKQEDKSTKVELSDNAIKLTTNTLKNDNLVKDVSLIMSDDKKTILAAIQVDATTNEKKAKDLVETTARQLGTFCGGKVPEKTYLGEVWDKYDGHIRIFSEKSNVIMDGYISN